ncbi:MAG: pseudouridine synthase [Planctomycetota bacterium]|jgi:pseudouridine synthase
MARRTRPAPSHAARRPAHAYADDRRGPRLQKVLAEAGVGSRRACEALVEAGDVAVNGTVVSQLPAWVDPGQDRITVRGRRVRPPESPVYVMLFKPRGVVCTNDDPEGRRRAIDLVKHPSRSRLYPVGRLDMDSSGLLLLTNDGPLANRLAHPRYHLPKVYEVTVKGSLDDDDVRRLERGLFLPDRRAGRGKRTARSRLRLLKRDRDRTRLRLDLREGRNRQIRRMMLRVGHPVKKLRRIQLGPLRLRGLRAGQWRDLMPREIDALRAAAAAADSRD